jgi:acylphosphatase
MIQTKIICKGKVQGVGFRYATKAKALGLNLCGTVANLKDNSVIINASGSQPDIIQLIDWCHMGPKASNVKELIISYRKIKKLDLDSFSILR